MSGDDVRDFLKALWNIVIYSAVALALVVAVFEVLDRRYHLMREIFEENSVAAGVLAGSFVLGIFYAIAQIVVS